MIVAGPPSMSASRFPISLSQNVRATDMYFYRLLIALATAQTLLPLIPLISSLPLDHSLATSPSALSTSSTLLYYLLDLLPSHPQILFRSTPAEREFLIALDTALEELTLSRARTERETFDAKQELRELGKTTDRRQHLGKTQKMVMGLMEGNIEL